MLGAFRHCVPNARTAESRVVFCLCWRIRQDAADRHLVERVAWPHRRHHECRVGAEDAGFASYRLHTPVGEDLLSFPVGINCRAPLADAGSSELPEQVHGRTCLVSDKGARASRSLPCVGTHQWGQDCPHSLVSAVGHRWSTLGRAGCLNKHTVARVL